MSINIDLALISSIIESGEMSVAVSEGAGKDGVLSPEAKMYWDFIQAHWDKYNQAPSLELFQSNHPNYEHNPTGDDVEALCDELNKRKLRQELKEWVYTIVDDINQDVWKAKETLMQAATDIASRSSLDQSLYVAGSDVSYFENKMDNIAANGGITGIAFPWDAFNKKTRGIEPGNCIYIYGRQKSKKTFLILYMALHYWKQGLKVLIFTREMSHEELMWRLIALETQQPIHDITKSNVTTKVRGHISSFLKELKESERFLISSNQDGITGFKTTIEQTRPDIVFHDYFKAMADDAMGLKARDPRIFVEKVVDQIVDYFAKDKKGQKKIPCIFVGHANRAGDGSKGSSSVEHAWSDHITRRVHCALRVISNEETNRTALIVNEGRILPKGTGITIDGTLCQGFGNFLESGYSWVGGDSKDKKQDFRQKTANRLGGIDVNKFRRT